MKNNLNAVLEKIEADYRENIQADGRNYLEVSISRKAAEMGFSDIEECYKDVYAIVPLQRPVNGMKVRIDGRTFVNYNQFASGIVVPNYVSENSNFSYRPYAAQHSMICNYA